MEALGARVSAVPGSANGAKGGGQREEAAARVGWRRVVVVVSAQRLRCQAAVERAWGDLELVFSAKGVHGPAWIAFLGFAVLVRSSTTCFQFPPRCDDRSFQLLQQNSTPATSLHFHSSRRDHQLTLSASRDS